jgi:hypothetical protein
MKKPFFLIFLIACFILVLVCNVKADTNPAGLSLTSCDSSGAQTEVYNVGQAMCLSGTGFAALTTYNVYVVNHIDWTDGTVIPSRVGGSATTVTTDASGAFFAYVMWSSAQAGVTDMVIDVNGDGLYISSIDAKDGNHITGTFAVPECPSGVLLAVVGCVAAFAVFRFGFRVKRTNLLSSLFWFFEA